MPKRTLQTGIAYHGNRMPSHYREDLKEMIQADLDIVVHMLSHTDWSRHKTVMKDIFAMTEAAGMEVWVDNWGLAGAPGDRSQFLCHHPGNNIIYSNGEISPNVCLNSPEFRQFTKDWLDTVAEIGGKTVFWDEPALPAKAVPDGEGHYYTCTCPRCKKLFEEQYNRPMPMLLDADTEQFRTDTIIDYFREVTEYAHKLGLHNNVVVMLSAHIGLNLDSVEQICSLPYIENIGSDPYWYKKDQESFNPYGYVYEGTKKNLAICEKYNKEHNLWIQTYYSPMGREEEVIIAADAAYDAGARCILGWGFHGSESNDYRAANPERMWEITKQAFRRIRERERDAILEENRKKFLNK